MKAKPTNAAAKAAKSSGKSGSSPSRSAKSPAGKSGAAPRSAGPVRKPGKPASRPAKPVSKPAKPAPRPARAAVSRPLAPPAPASPPGGGEAETLRAALDETRSRDTARAAVVAEVRDALLELARRVREGADTPGSAEPAAL